MQFMGLGGAIASFTMSYYIAKLQIEVRLRSRSVSSVFGALLNDSTL